MNPPQKSSQLSTTNQSDTGKLPKKEKDSPKPGDFPSGDEEDREGGNAGPEEKRKP